MHGDTRTRSMAHMLQCCQWCCLHPHHVSSRECDYTLACGRVCEAKAFDEWVDRYCLSCACIQMERSQCSQLTTTHFAIAIIGYAHWYLVWTWTELKCGVAVSITSIHLSERKWVNCFVLSCLVSSQIKFFLLVAPGALDWCPSSVTGPLREEVELEPCLPSSLDRITSQAPSSVFRWFKLN